MPEISIVPRKLKKLTFSPERLGAFSRYFCLGVADLDLPWIRSSKTKPGRPKPKKPSAGRTSEAKFPFFALFAVGEPLI